MQPVEKLIYDENSSVRFNTIKRLETELKWIKLLQSASPLGLNDSIYQKGTSLNNLSSKLREHGRHAMLSFLSSLPIPVLRILDIEANRFYPFNALIFPIVRGCVQSFVIFLSLISIPS